MPRELRLRIVLERPPDGVDFALQSGRGKKYDSIQTQRSSGTDLAFDFRVTVGDGPDDGAPNFRGPVTQGPPTARFVYIGVGQYAGQIDSRWGRRIKIPLGGITREMLGRAMDSGGTLEARVPGTGKDGSPTCATTHPIGGWNMRPGSGQADGEVRR